MPMYTIQIQYNTIQYNTIQYNTIQYNTIQYNTIQYNTIQKFIALSTHIQHFKQTNIYTIIQFMITRFSEEHN